MSACLACEQSYITALRMAEEREAHGKKVFNKFDVDQSGTIDMDELLVLLDDLGMLTKLKSDPEEFVRDMFIKYDTNFDGVLSWEEFAGLQNACLDDALGRRKVERKPKGQGQGGTVEARKKLAAEKAAKKAAEAVRIHKQNMEMKARIQAQGKGKDPKALDAEVERQRRALAQARADAKAEEKRRLDAENRELAMRRRNVKAAVDDDITDDGMHAMLYSNPAASNARHAVLAAEGNRSTLFLVTRCDCSRRRRDSGRRPSRGGSGIQGAQRGRVGKARGGECSDARAAQERSGGDG